MIPKKCPFYLLFTLCALGCLSKPSEAREHKVSFIGISHSGCHGPCPAYSFQVKRDGSFEYYGLRFVAHKGKWVGTVDKTLLGRILKVIETSGFMGLQAQYRRGADGTERVTTTVVMDGRKKTVEDDAYAGPPELKSVEKAVESLVNTAKWQKQPSNS